MKMKLRSSTYILNKHDFLENPFPLNSITPLMHNDCKVINNAIADNTRGLKRIDIPGVGAAQKKASVFHALIG